MKFNSVVEERGNVTFAQFNNEQIYMLPFIKQDGLPKQYAHWQKTVDCMLDGIEVTSEIYLMIDQKHIMQNNYHRRPGLHIDGYWMPNLQCHGTGGPYHSIHINSDEDETIILASNITACRAFSGIVDANILHGGACDTDTTRLTEIIMKPNRVYAGNVTMLHESIPVDSDCNRTVVRLNIPGYSLLQ